MLHLPPIPPNCRCIHIQSASSPCISHIHILPALAQIALQQGSHRRSLDWTVYSLLLAVLLQMITQGLRLSLVLEENRRRWKDPAKDDGSTAIRDILGTDGMGNLIRTVPLENCCDAPLTPVDQDGDTGFNLLDGFLGKGKAGAKDEITITEEGDRKDGAIEEVRGIDVGYDAPPRRVVVNRRSVDPALWNKA